MQLSYLCFTLLSATFFAQTPTARYKAAETIYSKHASDPGFSHDGSPEAIAALTAMRVASEDAVVDLLARKPDASVDDLTAALCEVQSSLRDCSKTDGYHADVIRLSPQLFAASIYSGESGTVFIVGPRNGKPVLLWSIDAAGTQSLDPTALLSAWQADRAGETCHDLTSGHTSGTCGPLYASLGVLPSDSEGRPRFNINAGYAQLMGATIANQSSVWRWDGDHATLLWISWHATMMDQGHGFNFANGILGFWEKEEFRTFFSCGSCEGKQVIERLQITPTSVEYLGKTTTQPELELIDELFWRLAHGKPTNDIASPQVSRALRLQVLDQVKESSNIAEDYISVGMFENDTLATPIPGGEKFCFIADELGRMDFTIRLSPSGHQRLTHVSKPAGTFDDCAAQPSTKQQ